MGPRFTFVVAVFLLVGAVVSLNTTAGRRWLEDRLETVRWFTNEVRTLHPTTAPH